MAIKTYLKGFTSVFLFTIALPAMAQEVTCAEGDYRTQRFDEACVTEGRRPVWGETQRRGRLQREQRITQRGQQADASRRQRNMALFCQNELQLLERQKNYCATESCLTSITNDMTEFAMTNCPDLVQNGILLEITTSEYGTEFRGGIRFGNEESNITVTGETVIPNQIEPLPIAPDNDGTAEPEDLVPVITESPGQIPIQSETEVCIEDLSTSDPSRSMEDIEESCASLVVEY